MTDETTGQPIIEVDHKLEPESLVIIRILVPGMSPIEVTFDADGAREVAYAIAQHADAIDASKRLH